MDRRKMRAGCGAVGGWRVLWIVVWAKAQTAVRVVSGMVRAALAAGAPTPTGGRFSAPKRLRSGFEAIFARKYDGYGVCG